MMKRKSDTKKPRASRKVSGVHHFEVDPLLKKYPNARYYFLLGARSAGKTYPTLKRAIMDAIDGKGVFAYVRRYKESIADSKIQDLLAPHVQWLSDYTNGKWNRFKYYRKRWYLERWETDENGDTKRVEKDPVPIGGAFAMNTWETDKGPDFAADKGGMAHIIIDEVLSAGGEYLNDEWQKFQNVISSLVRDNYQKDTKIWLLSNPVSKFGGPYMKNLGITKKLMENFGTTLIEYPGEDGKPSGMSCLFVYIAPAKDKDGNAAIDPDKTAVYNTFFAFPASKGKSKSITHGYWEMDDATLLESGIYKGSDKKRTLYFVFDEECLACEFMKYRSSGVYYLFIRPASKVPDKQYFVTLGSSLSKYAIIAFAKDHPMLKAFAKIYNTNQVYYSDLGTADAFHGCIRMCYDHVN